MSDYNIVPMDEHSRMAARLVIDCEHFKTLLGIERAAHTETRRKLEKAEHDRERYARRIRFLQSRHAILSREYNAIRKERDVLEVSLVSCEKALNESRSKEGRTY